MAEILKTLDLDEDPLVQCHILSYVYIIFLKGNLLIENNAEQKSLKLQFDILYSKRLLNVCEDL